MTRRDRKKEERMAQSMTDSSVVPIDGGTGAREQVPHREGGEPLHTGPEAGELKEQPTQLETPKAVGDAVDDPMAKERDALA